MIALRPANQRGRTAIDWLDSRHTFSFGDYYDLAHMGFRSLRVINDDRIAPGGGFGRHPHRDMEIVTCVLEGALEHRDSLGTGSVIRAGDVQRMTAGTGILHSEYNPSRAEPVHLVQIWILPERRGLAPGYEQKAFGDLDNRLRLVASRDARDGALQIHQDAELYIARLKPGARVRHSFKDGRLGWLQVARGSVQANGQKLEQGDGAALKGAGELALEGQGDAEVLLFDMGP